MGRGGRFGTCPSSSSPESSSSDEPGDKGGGSLVPSSEKSSIDAGSEGEVMLSPEMSGEMVMALSGCSVAGVAFAVTFAGIRSVFNDRRVGRFGVDLDWKPAGTGGGLGGVPLLCGGIVAEVVVVVDGL